MERQQLALLDERHGEDDTGRIDWRLDDRTREVGRLGVAAARQALRDARRRPAA